MVRRHLVALRVALVIADAISATLVFGFVSLVRFGDGDVSQLWARIGIDIRLAAVLFGLAWVAALWSGGLYRLRVRWRLLTEARDIAKASVLVLVITLSTLFVFKQDNVSRVFLGLLFVAQPLVTLAGRVALRSGFGAFRRRGYNAHFMLIVGTGSEAQTFADRVEVPDGPGHSRHRPPLGTGRGSHRCLASRARNRRRDGVDLPLPGR